MTIISHNNTTTLLIFKIDKIYNNNNMKNRLGRYNNLEYTNRILYLQVGRRRRKEEEEKGRRRQKKNNKNKK